MAHDKRKLKNSLPAAEAAQMLRQLAAEIEAGEVSLGEDKFKLSDGGEVKIKLKADEGEFSLKLKSRLVYDGRRAESGDGDESEEVSGDGGKPKYKKLKKSMEEDWEAIRKTLEGGSMPDQVRTRAFCDSAMLMTTYQDKGEEYYADFRQAVQSLLGRVERSDLDGARLAAAQVQKLRKTAHDEYK